MIRDRFHLQRDIRKAKPRRLQEKIDKSCSLAEARAASVPKVLYPDVLPISSRVEDIAETIKQNQVVIIAGETGSGKTTQIPKICLEMGLGVFGTIGHTQPRVVAARTVSQRIAEELGVNVGEQVGYQVRFTDRTSKQTHIKIMTDGILLAETQNDRFLEQYQVLIIDEAHERSLNIDFLLGYIKRILPRRPDLKVIVTSATIDLQRFSEHFSDAPIIEVSGRTYPVKVYYRPIEDSKSSDTDQQMYQGVLDALDEVEKFDRGKAGRGDVLVFLPGEREIRELATEIRKSKLNAFDVLPLYSRLSVSEQNRVFQAHSKARILLVTNVAETSLTVPGIHYVIDPGVARISRYSYRSKVQQLPIEPVSQASADQRKGRCGRVAAGVCIRLYSEDDFLSRPAFTPPEIMRTNLAAVILQMLMLRLGDMANFPFVERPDQRQVNDGFQLLHELQAVDNQRGITRLGKEMAKLPVDPRFARMLLEAGRTGCLSELLIITSALSVQDPRERPHDHQQDADTVHRQYWDEQSDFLAFVNLWKSYEDLRKALTQNKLRRHCRTSFLSYMRMREWRDVHRQLHLVCKDLKLRENKKPADYASVHRALLSGILGNIGQKKEDNEYAGARNRTHYIFPGSSQFKSKPKWIVASELVETTRLYARCVARIDNAWIEPLAQHLVRRNVSDPKFDPKRGQVVAYEDVSLYGIVIVNRRPIDFGALQPIEAREIFVHSALVEQELNSTAKFFKHNRRLIEEIEKLESKSRKRDILADTQALYSFYDEKLPANVCSEIDLREFLKQNERALYLNRELLMKQQVELSERVYPNALKVADAELKLDYQFDPQDEEDGVSLNVPVAILRQVSKAQLDWVIPGLLREKCLALIKSLPKSLRKNFVPAPEHVDKAVEQLEYDGRSLADTLAERLFRMTGVKVSGDDFNVSNLDKHLMMNIRVVDEKGKVLGAGRDLEQLRQTFAQQADQSFQKRSRHKLEQDSLTDWSFDELPAEVEIKHGGMLIRGYPALIDKGDSVSLEILDARDTALRSTPHGLLRLIVLQLQEQKKYLGKNISGFDRFAVYYATRGTRDQLLQDLVMAIFRYTFIEDKPPVTGAVAFRDRLIEKSHLMMVANEVAGLLNQVLREANEVEEELERMATTLNRYACDDIRQQLAQLIGPGFLQRVSRRWLLEYPRYLKAIRYRIDRIQGSLSRDQEATKEIADFTARISGSDIDAETELYRWMVEEYRISLFAQAVGTSLPVSSKRLEKQWQISQQKQVERKEGS